ncbi:MBL fold metallo-hydrolase [Erwinia persicina]|uniref:MBL fold metallo-hydrolase n=1 Tax=Erwinia persicina TaxID=55211 RepID=UPI00177DE21E|nr:MBL fold metallo-hydrolase [Erwinia persicina]MBD8166984.1 MBL fold metallo-hydrolase [Erwinia persicina]MCQ4095590.1 MBL fold metallo-hydrolase [Erwinia persicina]MCQ4102051.1 MBL fold metallo-hydrolase [Erwinia persicina]
MAWQNPWYNPCLPHHTREGFRNAEADMRQDGDLRRWRRERKQQGLPLPPSGGYKQFIHQWWQPASLSGEADAVWWLGHACLMLRTAGRYTLIDPVLSNRASPLSFIGPARKTPPALAVEDLPALDVVLISHNHYDHLDRETIKKILRRFPQVTFVVPLGLQAWFQRLGARQVVPLDWWQQTEVAGLTIHAVPARHWSMRTLWDRNRSLWCGWVIQHVALNFWFSGDSGYSENLLEIARRLGPFNLAALPVGAYAPKWFMAGQHMDPDQAVSLHHAIGQPYTIPIHWGVFELADESLDEPPQALETAMQSAGLDTTRFNALRIGAHILLDNIN